MKGTRVFLTGASGQMGYASFLRLYDCKDISRIVVLLRNSRRNHQLFDKYKKDLRVEMIWGDLKNFEDIYQGVLKSNLVIHMGALVSPQADYQAQEAMAVNYGSTVNILKAISIQKRSDEVRLIYIATVAQTGDRMWPIHWGRVGDPIKPSIFDYYAVSKTAAERAVIESGLSYWISLRQTGILSAQMAKIKDPIIFHNGLNNVLEYVSDRDSARLIENITVAVARDELEEEFWKNIYNIGGGKSCRITTLELYQKIYGEILGIKKLDYVIKPKLYATHNFHGQYYLDSEFLEQRFHFRQDGMDYFYELVRQEMGLLVPISRLVCRLPWGKLLMGKILVSGFRKLAGQPHGPLYFVTKNKTAKLDVFFGGLEKWQQLPEQLSNFQVPDDYNQVIMIDHGYDETKPEALLDLDDVKAAAKFRGGSCLSKAMVTGDLDTKLDFCCGFNHRFLASPRLVLKTGHWCPVCENKSWNYQARAKVDPFFNQVWAPLTDELEVGEIEKMIKPEEII